MPALFGTRRVLTILATLAWFVIPGAGALHAEGLITVKSRFDPNETMQRLETAVKAKGFTVFNRIDHSAAAAGVGLNLRPTILLIFGNPKGGTPLMQSVQTIGLDLPLKALVWQDGQGVTWLSYNDTEWMAHRHGAGEDVETAVHTITGALAAVASAATSPAE